MLEECKEKWKLEYISNMTGTYTMLIEEDLGDYYTGYTENYIKVYLPKSDNLNVNEFVRVEVESVFKDGALVKLS